MTLPRPQLLLAAAFVLVLGALPTPAEAQTVAVTSTADSGPGSLRAAIDAVNSGTANVIDMTGLAGAISLTTPLPAIVNAATINGPGGALTIDGAAAGSVLVSLANAGASVVLNDVVIADGLTKAGAGTLQWEGAAQSYFGATTLQAGTLATTTDFLLSASSPVTLSSGTLLDLTGTAQEVGALAGAGSVQLGDGGELTTGVLDTDTAFDGAIAGGASSVVIKDGAGQWTLGGSVAVEEFVVSDGAVTLAAGATLDADNVDVGGTLVLGSNQSFGDLFLDAGGTLDLGGHTLTLDGGSFGSLVMGTIAGTGGSLHVTGDVNVTFLGQGTYTGSTIVSGNAALGLFGPQALSADSALVINDNGYVEVEDAQTFRALSGNGGTLLLCDCADVTFVQDIDTTFAGALVSDPASTLTKAGTGRLRLTGDGSSFLGTIAVTGGVLEGTTTSLTGNISNDATLEFNQDADGIYGGEISGAGALVKSGDGTVELGTSSSYTGGTIINAGTLVAGADDALGFGSLTMNGGTVRVDFLQDVTSLSGAAGTVQVDGDLSIDQDGDTTFGGILAGSGAIEKRGDGMLTLTGANTFTGDFALREGVLALGGAGALSSVSLFEIDAGAEARLLSSQTFGDMFIDGTLAVGSHTLTLDSGPGGTFVTGNVTGSGAIVVDGLTGIAVASALDFTGSLTFRGNSSSVVVADNAFAQASSITIDDNAYLEVEGLQTFRSLSGNGGELFMCFCATVTIDQNIDTTFAGNITDDGSGVLVKAGAGRLMLAGTTSYLGGTTVAGGTLAGTTNSLQGAIANNATLEFDQAFGGAFGGSISGTGAVVKNGTGAVTFGAANTYTGGTILNAGTLVAGAAGALGSGSLVVNGGTLDVNASQAVASLAGAGGTIDIETSDALTVDQSGATSYGGTIVGSGALVKIGSGALTLTGANTYAGGTTVSGGVLAGTSTSLQGAIVNNAQVQFDQGIDGTYAGAMSGSGALVKTGSGVLTLTGANTYTGGTTVSGGVLAGTTASLRGNIVNQAEVLFAQTADGTYAGLMSGGGSLSKTGAGVLTLSGGNTYTGGTSILGGTLQMGAHGAVGSGLVTATGLWNLNGFNAAVSGLAGGGAVTLGGGTLDVGWNHASSSFTGVISGAGSLVKSGNGTLTLAGANTYSGGTTVLAGTLAGNASSLQGAIANHSEVRFDQTDNGVFGGAITGSGTVVKTGDGVLFVAGSLHHLGGTFVLGGTLSGSAESLDGAIVNQARVEFVQDGVGVFDGVISGTGSVTTRGAGTVVFNHANSYSGGTTIAGGTLRVASDASLGAASGALTFSGGTLAMSGSFASTRDVRLAAAGTFDTGNHTAVLAGAISGAGSLTKLGSGVMWLTGSASHTGGTHVLAGVLGGTTSTLHGTIRNDATVVFDQAAAGTFTGTMSGTGSVIKSGAGQLTINGVQAYSGVTTVAEGALELGGSLAGSVFVAEGASFGGSGSVAGGVFAAGRISAGSFVSIGGAGGGADFGAGAHALTAPMRIAGDLLLAGSSTYEAHVAEDASIATMTVGGRAVIDGATLHLIETTAGLLSTARRQTSTVLTASEIVGGFGAVTGLDAAFDPYLLTMGNSVALMLVRNNIDFASFARSLNGSGAGAALAAAQAGAAGDVAYVVRELSALDTDEELAGALDRISGAAHASFAGISMIGSADAIDVLTSRFSGRGGWWAQGLGASLSLDADLDPGASSVSSRGLLAGYDRRWTRAMAGVAGGYHDSGVDAGGGLDRLDARAYRGAVYGEFRAGRLGIDAIVAAASHRVRGTRAIRFAATIATPEGRGLLFGGVDRTALFAYDATEIAAVADAGYALDVSGFEIRPSVGAQLTRVSRDAFAESGAGSLSLMSEADSVSSPAARARLVIARRVDGAARRWIAPRAGLRYTHALGGRDVPFTASLAGTPFTARGFALPASLFSATAGVAAGLGPLSLSVDYRVAVAAGQRHHLVSAGIGF